jgi:ribosomal protein S18 acetylase RimI-like enzyme
MTHCLFADRALCRRIEAAEAGLVLAGGRTAVARSKGAVVAVLGTGAAVWTGEGPPFDKVVGLGLGPQPLLGEDFAAFEATVLARGGTVRVELATRADPDVGHELTSGGYRLDRFEDVLARRLAPDAAAASGGAADVEIAEVAPAEVERWIDALVTGFATPDHDCPAVPPESSPRALLERIHRELIQVDGFQAFLARCGGEIVGGASLRIDQRVAQMCGAATLPGHRRRGVQSALTGARLAAAARAGCDVATVTTLPGSRSQQNAIRQGFSLIYSRAVLVKAAR